MNEIEQNEIKEMARDIKEIENDKGHQLINETLAYVKEHHKYNPKKDFSLAHTKTIHELVAEEMIKLGYRNVKDKIVLSKEEQERLNATEKRIKQLKNEINDYKQRYASAEKRYEQLVQSSCEALAKKGKETARDFYHEIMSYIGANQKFWIVDDEHITIINVDELFDFVIELAKQYGVEVE